MLSFNVCTDKNPTEINMLSFLSVVEFLNENWALILDAQVLNCQRTGCTCSSSESSKASFHGQMCTSALLSAYSMGLSLAGCHCFNVCSVRTVFWSNGYTYFLSPRSKILGLHCAGDLRFSQVTCWDFWTM